MLALVFLQEVEQQLGLTAARTEMDVGQEDCAIAGRFMTFDDGHVDKDSIDTKYVVRDCTNLSRLCMSAVATR